MSVIASPLIAVESAAGSTDLWLPECLFVPDWAARFLVHTSWRVDVVSAESLSEARTAGTPKPLRTIEMTVLALGAGEADALRSLLERSSMARSLVPLWCDQAILTATPALGGTVLTVAGGGGVEVRRFCIGGRVAIVDGTARSFTRNFEIGTIAAVDAEANTVTLAGTLTGVRQAGDLVVPLLEADLVTQLSSAAITDTAASASLTYREVLGPMSLDPWVVPGTALAGLASYQGYPILGDGAGGALEPDWGKGGGGGGIQLTVERVAEVSGVGLGMYTQTHGARFKAGAKADYLQLDRASAAALLTFFDAMGGQQKAFLYPNPTADLRLIGIEDGTHITVAADSAAFGWAWRPFVGLRLLDGSWLVRAVSSVSRGTGSGGGAMGIDTLILADALPDALVTAGVGGVQRTSLVHLVRFASDEVTENWINDAMMQTTLGVIEVLEEKSIDLLNLASPVVGGTALGAANGTGSGGSPPPNPPICTSTIAPTVLLFDETGGTAAVAIGVSDSHCRWVVGGQTFSTPSATAGTGSGSINVTVAAADPSLLPRTDTLAVGCLGAQTLTVRQAGWPLTFLVVFTANDGSTVSGWITMTAAPNSSTLVGITGVVLVTGEDPRPATLAWIAPPAAGDPNTGAGWSEGGWRIWLDCGSYTYFYFLFAGPVDSAHMPVGYFPLRSAGPYSYPGPFTSHARNWVSAFVSYFGPG